jgi:ferredoxin
MKVWNAGDKSKAGCETCKAVVPTTFGIHDVKLEASGAIVEQIMAASCDQCGEVVAIPPQSTPAVRAVIRTALDSSPL